MRGFFLQTFGCQMNAHDSMRMAESLDRAGYTPVHEPSQADLFVVNTCSVREKAEHKLMSLLGRVRHLKEEKRDLVVVVAGCVAQQEGDRLLKKAPVVDLVIGPDNIAELPELLSDIELGAPPRARTEFDLASPAFLSAKDARHVPLSTALPGSSAQKTAVSSYVTVMKGCDERCTFCIVPYTRGPERYRPADTIIAEIQALVSRGVREVTLLGQTVNSWYEPRGLPNLPSSLAPPSEFAALLHRISSEVPGLLRLRYTSPHPRHITSELISAHRELDLLPRHVHMPVQSGSNAVLKRMLRRYTRELYIDRVKALQTARAGLTLSTDIIVGFPGETRKDFENTLSLVEEVGFCSAFVFKYSQRPYTPALKLDDDVSEQEKDARLQELLALVESQQRTHLRTLEKSTQTILLESTKPVAGSETLQRATGRTERNEIVHVDLPAQTNPIGAELEVRITEAYDHSLRGELVSQEQLSTLATHDGSAYTLKSSGGYPGALPSTLESAAGAPDAAHTGAAQNSPTRTTEPRKAHRRLPLVGA